MKTAILITYDKEDAVSEATALCDSAGYKVSQIIKQKFLKRPKYGISEEMIEKLEDDAKKIRPDVIVYDEILKPSQNYNLASKLHRNILDREALILEIFESRASSSESKLQVKLAQMRYEMSRAKEKVRLARMGEQPGFLGIGKFEVDVYYNDIKHRMETVKSKLKKAGKQRELHRQSRKRLGFKTISLAGYTSAGKTTLFNKLTGEQREKNDELFTTLSTTVRRLTINQKAFLISDTVGFISKLPAYMIQAFKSTLEELLYSDLVVVVIDASDSLFDLKKKFKSCKKTLNEIGVEQDRIVYALNKADLLDKNEILEKVEYLGLAENKKWISVSAKTGQNTKEFKELIKNVIDSQHKPTTKKKSLKEELEKIYGN
ncbi:MAG: GTPase HflX [Nitrosopumilaceae archaeon]